MNSDMWKKREKNIRSSEKKHIREIKKNWIEIIIWFVAQFDQLSKDLVACFDYHDEYLFNWLKKSFLSEMISCHSIFFQNKTLSAFHFYGTKILLRIKSRFIIISVESQMHLGSLHILHRHSRHSRYNLHLFFSSLSIRE